MLTDTLPTELSLNDTAEAICMLILCFIITCSLIYLSWSICILTTSYFAVKLLKQLFETVDNHLVIDFIKDTYFDNQLFVIVILY